MLLKRYSSPTDTEDTDVSSWTNEKVLWSQQTYIVHVDSHTLLWCRLYQIWTEPPLCKRLRHIWILTGRPYVREKTLSLDKTSQPSLVAPAEVTEKFCNSFFPIEMTSCIFCFLLISAGSLFPGVWSGAWFIVSHMLGRYGQEVVL